ncbi:MAG: cbb3-type cytochrome oxidase assembly protein CcoS [bacterium]|nr:cbb3-type cytochrome oxidase assembly protein CcoS [bacterium]
MDFVYVLLPLALLLGFIALMAFMWTLKSGQYDDLDGAAWRAIMDDDQELNPNFQQPANEENSPQDPVDKGETQA